ncbi:MAG: methyltransferase domain-containing protein [Nitrospinaceae bacterium]
MNAEKVYIPKDSSFLTTDTRAERWAVPYSFDCLNARIGILLDQQKDALEGKRILDIGSHIGTFAYAALNLGARFVHGVDAEEKMVERCLGLFKEHGVPEPNYRFEAGDIFAFLENAGENCFDTLMCFGMLYYTPEPYRLLRLMLRAARETVLLDTFTAGYAAVQGKDALDIYPNIKDETLGLPLMIVSLTQTEKKDYRLPHSFEHKGKDLSMTTLPTESLLEIWFRSLGADFKRLDWSGHITRACSFRDLHTPKQKKESHWADVYASGVRVSYRLDRR